MDTITLILVLALISLLGLVILTGMFRSLKFSLLVVLLVITFVDLIRKLLGGELWLLVAIDVSLLFLVFRFYAPYLLGSRRQLGIGKEMDPLLKLALGLYVSIVLIQALNPNVPSWLVALAGLRSYLLAIPLIGVGWYVASTWRVKDYERASRVIRVLIVLSVLVGMLAFITQAFGIATQPYLSSVLLPIEGEHVIHSFGLANVELISSFFAGSKRWARYLLFLYPFVWAYFTAVGKRGAVLYFSGVVLFGLFISGSREGLVLFLFFHAARYAISNIGRLVAYAGVVGMVVLLILAVYPTSYPGRGDEGLLLRARFYLSVPEDWIYRARYMFGAPADLILTGGETGSLLTGNGVGSYGQETRLLATRRELPIGIPSWARDAGLLKIIGELGIPGLIAFIMLQAAILRYGRMLRTGRNDPFFIAAFLSAVIWLVLFLKSHPTLSDQMVNAFYWFYVGVLIHRGALARRLTFQVPGGSTSCIHVGSRR